MKDIKSIKVNEHRGSTKFRMNPNTSTNSVLEPKTSLRGIFSEYANPDLVSGKKHAWRKAVVKKHENS